MADQSPREQRGQTVRETWVAWAKRQRAPKRSWLIGWDDLDDGQREVDMLIGDALAPGLLPAEKIALTVASAVLARGDQPGMNTTAMLVLTIERLAGISDYTAEEMPDGNGL